MASNTSLFWHIKEVAETLSPKDASIRAFLSIIQFLSTIVPPPDSPIKVVCTAALRLTTQTSEPLPIL